MSINWTPSGPIVNANASATAFTFTDKIEGVARLVNIGTSVGFASINNASLSLADRFSPIMPDATLYVAFGSPQTSLEITGSEIQITPGFMLKDDSFLDKDIPFDPGSIFPFLWYDPSDITTLFQDSAMTIPVTADSDPVGAILDKSGNGHHLTQATAGFRPLYKTSGGLHWLEFDGVDDDLRVTDITLAQPYSFVAACRDIDASVGQLAFLGYSNGLIRSDGNIFHNAGTLDLVTPYPGIDVDFVATVISDDASSKIAIDNEDYAVGNGGANDSTYFQIGSIGGANPNIHLENRDYGVVVFNRLLTDPEIAQLRTYLAAKQGRTL